MNASLERLAKRLDLDAADHERLRLAFGRACAQRVEHLLEEQEAQDCLASLGRYLTARSGTNSWSRFPRRLRAWRTGTRGRHP